METVLETHRMSGWQRVRERRGVKDNMRVFGNYKGTEAEQFGSLV